MPVKAPKICDCGNAVKSGERCECRAKADTERKARFDQNRPSARERGYTSKWEQAREAFLAAHPICALPNCGQPARIVDHIKPHKGDFKLFWDRKNWQPLCTHCHSSRKQSEERRAS